MIIIEKSKFITIGFMRWLLKKIKQNIILNLDLNMLKARQLAINESMIFGVEIDLARAVKYIIQSLYIEDYKDNFSITINDNIRYPGTDIKLIDIYKVLTYGTLDIQPYSFIYKVLLDIKFNIKEYIKQYNTISLA